MKTVTLQLSVDSCKEVLKILEPYERELKQKMQLVCEKLAKIGESEAQFHAQFATGDGNDNVRIGIEPTERGYRLTMSGEDVYFVEFGTGIYAGEYAGDASRASVGTNPADYSVEHAQMFYKHGYWWWENRYYQGTPASMPMYYAGKKMREEMPRIIREVFK